MFGWSPVVGFANRPEKQMHPISAASAPVLSDEVMKACHAVMKEFLYPMG